MKNLAKSLIAVVFVLLLTQCQDQPDRIIFTGRIVYFTAPSVSLLENAETPLVLTVELSSPATSDVEIDFEVESEGATEGVDYELGGTSVTIQAGESTGSVEISPIDNGDLDFSRKIVFSISSISDQTISISAERETVISLINDDCPVKTGIWTVEKDDNAYEIGGDYIYTATFGPNENGDCNILLIYNIGDWGGDKGVVMNFEPDSEGATFGTVTISKQGIGSYGSTGERTVEGVGTYDEETKLIEIFYTFYYGDGSEAYSDDVVFDAN